MSKASLKRLNINLPESSYNQLQSLAQDSHRSMTDVVRTALGLVKVALEEEKKNRTLAVTAGDRIVKEIVLPS